MESAQALFVRLLFPRRRLLGRSRSAVPGTPAFSSSAFLRVCLPCRSTVSKKEAPPRGYFSFLIWRRRRESNPTLNSLYVQLLRETAYIARFTSLFLQNRSINMSNVSQKTQQTFHSNDYRIWDRYCFKKDHISKLRFM